MTDAEELKALRRMAELEAKSGGAAPQAAAPSRPPISTDVPTGMRGALEATLSLGTGAVAGAAGLAAGAAGTMIPGPRGQGQEWMDKTQEALTYQPRTDMGKRILETATLPLSKFAELTKGAGHSMADLTGSPAAGALTDATLNAVPYALGRGLKGPVNRAMGRSAEENAATASRNSVLDTTLAEGRAEGYVIPKSAYDPTFASNKLESVGGKAAINQEASAKNQTTTDKIARREAGLDENSPLSMEALEEANHKTAQPYRDVAALSPMAGKWLNKLIDTRTESKAAWNEYNRGQVRSVKQEAKNLDAKAERLEEMIDKEASQYGKPGLVEELRDARVKMAKNYQVQRALNVGAGEVDAAKIGRMYAKNKGKGMTGGLATIGKTQQAFGRLMKQGSNSPPSGVSHTEALAAVAFGMAGAAMGGGGAVFGAAPLLRGIPRSIALSKMMQKPREYQPGMGLKLSQLASAGLTGFGAVAPSVGLRRKED